LVVELVESSEIDGGGAQFKAVYTVVYDKINRFAHAYLSSISPAKSSASAKLSNFLRGFVRQKEENRFFLNTMFWPH
jgi:hypothetical protein